MDAAPIGFPEARPTARSWPRRMLIGLNVLVAIALIGSGLTYGYLRYRNGQITREAVKGLAAEESAGSPTTILLVGSNTRTGLDPAEIQEFGSATQVGGARSDVTMLVHLDPRTKKVNLLSLPRDLFIPVPGTDRLQRVDAALNDGPTRLVEVIQNDLGIPINHYVELNFDSFQSVVNAIGGVDMQFPTAVRDSFSGLNLKAGCLHLNGKVALSVVRARHLEYYDRGRFNPDPYGDLSRIRRNHEFLRVLARAVQGQGVENPLTLNSIVGTLVPKLKVDSGLSLGTMVTLARQFRSLDAAAVPQATLPVLLAPSYRFRGVPYGDVVLPNQPQDQEAVAQFLGQSAPAPSGDKGTISLLNESGNNSAATKTSDALRGLGWTVTDMVAGSSPATPSESVIYYPPGKLGAAQHLQTQLSGPVALGLRAVPTGADLQLVIGTDLKVTGGIAPVETTTTTPSTSAPGRNGTTSTTRPQGVVVTGDVVTVQEAPQAFDPTACPAGVKGH
ncbi:MAG: hypothetical protein NVS3B21_32700 [Acidimicrobiales bacterium]